MHRYKIKMCLAVKGDNFYDEKKRMEKKWPRRAVDEHISKESLYQLTLDLGGNNINPFPVLVEFFKGIIERILFALYKAPYRSQTWYHKKSCHF